MDRATSPAPTWSGNSRPHIGKYSSPIVVDGLIYTAADNSFITCLEAATGQVVWTERIGGNFEASPVYAGGTPLLFQPTGCGHLPEPGPTCERPGDQHFGRRLYGFARRRREVLFFCAPRATFIASRTWAASINRGGNRRLLPFCRVERRGPAGSAQRGQGESGAGPPVAARSDAGLESGARGG